MEKVTRVRVTSKGKIKMREKIQQIFSEQSIQRKLLEKFHIEFVVLFGSIATGTGREESDIDLGVLFHRALSRREEESLVDFLRKLLKVDRLDVVCLNDVSCALRYEATQNGVLLLEREEDKYLNFCIRTFKEFEEMNFLNRHYHEAKIKELKEFLNVQS